MRVVIFMVGDHWTDVYGFFSTRALAQAWIDRQNYLRGLAITEWTLDEVEDLHASNNLHPLKRSDK